MVADPAPADPKISKSTAVDQAVSGRERMVKNQILTNECFTANSVFGPMLYFNLFKLF